MKVKSFRKIIATSLAILTLLSTTPVFAASTGSVASDPSVGKDVLQSAYTEYEEKGVGSSSTDVYLTVDNSDIKVKVPTKIILSGAPTDDGEYIGRYSVEVSGDMSGEQILSVTPKIGSMELIQDGKDNMPATISQEKTAFTSDDLAINTTTTGQVTAVGLTAGKWHAQNAFDIEIMSHYSLYSSLELAATDANNLTTENADVMRDDFEHAVCGLYISNNTVYIRMFKSESDVENITFNNATNLNLNNNVVEFADGESGLSFSDDLSVYNGDIKVNGGSYALQGNRANTGGQLSVSNVNMESVNQTSMSASNLVIDTSTAKTTINSVNINVNGNGSMSYNCTGIVLRNNNADVTVTDTTVNMSTSVNQIQGIQAQGNILVSNCDFDLLNTADGGSTAYGIRTSTSGTADITINSVDISVDGNSIVSNTNDIMSGSGLGINSGSSVTINGDEESTKITCFGNVAINAAAGSYLTINGGYFASPNHGGLYSLTGSTGSLKINGGTFVNNYNEYSEDRYDFESDNYVLPYGAAYIGANDGTTDQVINISNATFINTSESTCGELLAEKNGTGSGNEYGKGVNFTTNFGYSAIAEANFYDCTIISRYASLRVDSSTTTVNLYGNTTLDGSLTAAGRQEIYNNGTVNDYTDTQTTTTISEGLRFIEGSKIVGAYSNGGLTGYRGSWLFTELNIPEGTEWINHHAFCNCTRLETVIIPDSVTKISDAAFENCTRLTNVKMSDTLLKQLGDDNRIDDVFNGSPCVDTLLEQYSNL